MLAARWLRVGGDDLALSDKLALTKAVCDATDARDRCLARLGIDRRDAATITASLYAATTATGCDAGEPEATGTTAEPA
jgi:hypothetical protein